MRQALRGLQRSCPGGRAVDTDTFAVYPSRPFSLPGKVRAAVEWPPAGALPASGQREDALSLRLVPAAVPEREAQAM